MMEKAVILSTGDELITGRVVDTNSAYIADKLYGLGLEVAAVLKVGDSRERLLWALRNGLEMGDLVIGTGGLGPTTDDLTTEVVGEFFGSSKGLGYMIASAATNYKVDVVFVGVAIFMGLSLILTLSVKKLESNLTRWRPEQAKTF